MHIFNFYENVNQHKISIASSDGNNLNNALSSLKDIMSLYIKEWHEKDEIITFRIEVIDQENEDIRNIIWKSKQGFFEVELIEKYVRHLINRETYQIWITDYANDESICKFAD